ncbi:MAG: Rha family transcriptional regulator [Allorhizobium sp.]
MDIIPIVTIKNNAVITNSRDVATYFGKEHFNVLQDIDKLIRQGVLDFQETPYVHEQNGQTYRMFEMTRDGFTLLAMGFTGKKALQFKLRYIERYNARDTRTPKAIGHL